MTTITITYDLREGDHVDDVLAILLPDSTAADTEDILGNDYLDRLTVRYEEGT